MTPQIYSGSRVTISIAGGLVAAGFVADYSIETSAQELDTIDSVFPAELAVNRIRVAMNIRVYRTPDNDPVLDQFAAGGSTLGQAEQKAFTQAKYINVEIKDNNDRTVLHIPKAWLVRRSGSVSMTDFLTENWSIIGMGYFGPSN